MSISCSLLLPVCQSPEILLHHCPSSAPPKYSAPRRVYRSRIRSNNIDSDVNISAQLREKKKHNTDVRVRLGRFQASLHALVGGLRTAGKKKKPHLFINIKAPRTNHHRQRVRTAANAPFTHDIPVKRPCSAQKKKPTCTAVNTRAVM